MNSLMVILIVLGVMLIVAFGVWFFLTDWRCSKIKVLIGDSLLILLSIAVLLVGLLFRDGMLEENRNTQKQKILEQIEQEKDADDM